MTRPTFRLRVLALLAALVAPALLRADAPSNVPQFCSFQTRKCTTCHGDIANECVLLSLDLGETTPWTGSMPVRLKVRTSEASPSLSTPSQLKLALGYTFLHLGSETPGGDGVNAATFSDEAGRSIEFRFESGSSVGVPRFVMGGDAQARLQMVDAEGWATLSDPAFFDLYPGDGSVWRYVASPAAADFGALARYVNPRGAAYTWDDMGVAVLRDASGFLRQVATRTRLADIVTHSATHYTVTVYPLTEEPQTDPDTGLLSLPPHDPVRVLDVQRGTTDRELIVGYQKGTGDMRTYRYVAKNGDWELTNPSGLIDANELYFAEDETGARRIHVWKDSDGTALRRMEANFVDKPWGWAMTNFVEGIPGDATRTTSWSYFESGPHRGLVQEQITPTGNRILYEYDEKSRVVRESMPLVEEETLYSYAPVDPSDPPLLCDTRPRYIVRKMQGVEIQRTYYVYGTNGVDVVERVGEQGAAYGGTNVLRTVTTFYPVTGAVTDGLVRSVRHEDGMIDNYAYALTNGVWTETITHVHEQAPAVVPMRTTRSVRVYNALGKLVDFRTDLCTIGVEDLVPLADWTPITRFQYAYDIAGNEIRREDLAGRLWTAEWANSCCGKVSETDWQGITKTYAHDTDGNLLVEMLQRPSPIEIHHTRDLLGRETTTFATNRIAKIGTGALRIEYAPSGNVLSETDYLGNVTRYHESNNGLTNEVVHPTGTVEMVVDGIDGRLLAVWGTTTIERNYEYGCNPDGSTWFIRRDGPQNATGPWKKETTDMLSRPLREEKHGFGGSVIATVFQFDSNGHLLSRTVTASTNDDSQIFLSRNLFQYDETGILVRHVRDLNGNGEVDLAGPDCITDYQHTFSVRDGAIWKESSEWIYPETGVETKVRTGSSRRMLTGLRDRVSIVEREDIRGIVTRTEVSADRERGKVVETEFSPTCSLPAVSVFEFGLLTETDSPDAITNRLFYDGLNRISVRTDGRGNSIRSTYDSAGLLSEREDESGARVSFCYDKFGRNTEIVDAAGTTTRIRYDNHNRVVHWRGPGIPVWVEYDCFGRMSTLSTTRDPVQEIPLDGTPANPDTTQWLRDEATGLVTNKVYPDGTGPIYEYEPDGRPKKRIWARGVETEWEYGSDRLVSHIRYSDGTPNVSISRGRLGNVVLAVCDGVSTNRFYYSPADLSLTLEEQDEFQIERLHDDFGRNAGYRTNRRNHLLSWDELGRLINIQDGPAGLETSYSYRYLPGTTLVTGMSSSTGFSWDWTFEPYRNKLVCVSNFFAGTPIVSFHYQNDPAARRIVRITEWRDSAPEVDFFGHGTADGEDRTEISEIASERFEQVFLYDGAGNRTHSFDFRSGAENTEFRSNGLGQLLMVTNTFNGAVQEFFYDADGNRISSGPMTLEWDAENRLREVRKTDPATGSETACIRYSYDYIGRLIHIHVIHSGGTETNTTIRFDGWNPIFESASENGSVHLERSFVWGVDLSNIPNGAGGVGGLLAAEKGTECLFPVFDGNGNIVAHLNETGETVARYSYNAWGDLIRTEGSQTSGFPFQFSSKRFDRETGLYWYGKRFYDPKTGRWISRDPIGERGGYNLYRFVEDNPIDSLDYLGMIDLDPEYESMTEDEKECYRAIGQFLANNKNWLQKLGMTYDPNDLSEMEYWGSENISQALQQDHGTCRFSVRCRCPGREPSGNCSRDGILGYNRKREIGRDRMVEFGVSINAEKDRIAGSHITICAGKGSPEEMKKALVHELQHAYDHCFKTAEKPGSKACVNGDYACECASDLCTEMRAYKLFEPDMSGNQIFYEILAKRGYLKDGYCRLARNASKSLDQIFDLIQERCSLDNLLTDIVPGGFNLN